jgi:cell division protein ZapA (FtsZ GTPase activity inhibitor)
MKISIGKKVYILPFNEKSTEIKEYIEKLSVILNKKVNETLVKLGNSVKLDDDALLLFTVFSLLDDLENAQAEIKNISAYAKTEELQTDLFGVQTKEEQFCESVEVMERKIDKIFNQYLSQL